MSEHQQTPRRSTRDIPTRFTLGLRRFMAIIVTAIIPIAILLVAYMSTGWGDMNPDTWTSFGIGAGIMLLVTLVWVPESMDKAKSDTDYDDVRTAMSDAVNRVIDAKQQEELSEYCKAATEFDRQDATENMLIQSGITMDEYERKYKALTPAQIKALDELTRNQKRILNRIRRGVKVKPYTRSEIITAQRHRSTRRIHNYVQLELTMRMAMKLLTSVAISFFLARILLQFNGRPFSEIAAQFAMWMITMCWNVYSSCRMGWNLVTKTQKNYYIEITRFVEEFEEWHERKQKTE